MEKQEAGWMIAAIALDTPEAALTLLIPLGATGIAALLPIIATVCAILGAVYVSYRQTIAAYPDGGGSYTVASENLGPRPGVVAGAALALDYILNVAVGISAGVGALISALPGLQPHTLALCLALITLVNLRGIKEFNVKGLPKIGYSELRKATRSERSCLVSPMLNRVL